MQLVPGFNRRFDRSAAGGYLEVRPFDFHRDGPAATIRFLTPGPAIIGHRDHARFDPNGINQILREGCPRPRGFSLAVGLNRTIVLAAGDLKVPIARFAEPLLQEGEAPRVSTALMLAGAGLGPHDAREISPYSHGECLTSRCMVIVEGCTAQST